MSTIIDRINEAERLKDAGQNEEAVVVLQSVLAEESEHVLAHLMLARIFTQLGRHAEAIDHGVRACEIEPTEAFNFTALSVTYQRAWAGTGDKQFITLAEEAMAQARMVG